MKKKSADLSLNRKVVSNLTKSEMSFLYGGDGDEDISMKSCEQTEDEKNDTGNISDEMKKKILNLFPTKLFC